MNISLLCRCPLKYKLCVAAPEIWLAHSRARCHRTCPHQPVGFTMECSSVQCSDVSESCHIAWLHRAGPGLWFLNDLKVRSYPRAPELPGHVCHHDVGWGSYSKWIAITASSSHVLRNYLMIRYVSPETITRTYPPHSYLCLCFVNRIVNICRLPSKSTFNPCGKSKRKKMKK